MIGGIGLGLGYISPVSTLIKWFPDRRGMATGMAIMGFGGGAMIGAPLANKLMSHFATPTSVGVMETFLCLAAIYFVFMLAGAIGYRVPADNWMPAGWTPPEKTKNAMITDNHVHLDVAWKTPPPRPAMLIIKSSKRASGIKRNQERILAAAGCLASIPCSKRVQLGAFTAGRAFFLKGPSAKLQG